MIQARIPFTMQAAVTEDAAPTAGGVPDPLPPGWVRIPVSFQVTLPAEMIEQAKRRAASGL